MQSRAIAMQTRWTALRGKFRSDTRRLHPGARELQLCAAVPRNHGDEHHGHFLHHRDQLDAAGIAMRDSPLSSLVGCERGAAATEFAVLFPALVGTLLGIIWASLLAYSAASLHYAVEGAARCYSVGSQCGSASAAQTYAQAH